MKIVVLDGYTLNPGDLSWDCLRQFGEVVVYPRTARSEVIGRIGDAQIIVINKTVITAEVFDACPSVRLVCMLATGYDVVDSAAARQRGIPVCNVPGYGTDSVAQFTFGLLLELCHRIALHDGLIRQGRWAAARDYSFWDTPQLELAGKTMGIIGFGRIGQAVGRIARAFGMRVVAYNRSRCREGAQIGEYVDLDTLLSVSDVVSLHCPLTAETAGIINRDTIARMKNGAMLLNTSRGALVDEAALAEALCSGKLRGAAADVVSAEPISENNPLLTAPNCILTPHMAWTPIESRQRILDCTVQNIRGFLEGKPVNVVN